MEHLAQTLKALSQPTRLRILLLLEEGELCVCDLMAVLDLPHTAITRHMTHLCQAGLVAAMPHDTRMHYRRLLQAAPHAYLLSEAISAYASHAPQAKDDRIRLANHLRDKQMAEPA